MKTNHLQIFRFSKSMLSVMIALGVLVVDQFSKWFAAQNGVGITINRGISFGIGTALPDVVMFLIVGAVVVGIFILLKDVWLKNPLLSGLFWGAVTSNILDRIIFGGVRDWLPLPILGIRNNLADIVIVITLAVLVFRER